MKLGLVILGAVIVLGGLIGTLVVRDPGYVLVAYDNQSVETSLWFAVVALLLLYFALRALIWLAARIWGGRGSIGRWNRRRQFRTAAQRTTNGLLLLAEGEWREAQRLLTSSAGNAAAPLINYLNAARAANKLDDAQARDELLRKAHESTPGAKLPVGITQAELQFDAGQYEQSIATLLQLRSQAGKHPKVLTLLSQCYQKVGDWQALIEILPALRKLKGADAQTLDTLQRYAWSQQLGGAKEAGARREIWQRLPKALRRDSEIAAEYARLALADGQADDVEALLRDALDHRWDDSLVELYGCVSSRDSARQLTTLEGWQKKHPKNAALLLASGRIALQNQAWDKARTYFEGSMKAEPSPAVYAELGRLCCAQGEVDRGMEYYGLSQQNLPKLPLPS